MKEQAYGTDRKETKNAVASDDALLIIEECYRQSQNKD